MIKIFKKNQIVFMAIGLMLIVAGYLNYTYSPELKYQTELTGNIEENLGDTIYVNTIPVDKDEQERIKQNNTQANNTHEHNNNIAVQKEKDTYFTETKNQRDEMLDSQIDTYEDMLENASIPNEQKLNAQQEIKKITDLKNNIMIAENLILLKEVEDVVIMTNGENITVVIKSENELESEKVAQIYSIVTRQLGVEINDIQIILKK
ncbi:MAG: SpoIIIAH-like family protein [Clostridiales bacterium]|nr:SpoIIIAH-like family protein [Clostridiales bacterium]